MRALTFEPSYHGLVPRLEDRAWSLFLGPRRILALIVDLTVCRVKAMFSYGFILQAHPFSQSID